MKYQYFLTTKHPDDSTQKLLIFTTTTGLRLGLKKFLIEKALSYHFKDKISLGNITDVIVISINNEEIVSWIPPINLAKIEGTGLSPQSFITNLEGLDRHVSIEEIQKHF